MNLTYHIRILVVYYVIYEGDALLLFLLILLIEFLRVVQEDFLVDAIYDVMY
jgi:hypothetical protein